MKRESFTSGKTKMAIVFVFTALFFLTQYQNCGPVPPEPVNTPAGSLGGSGSFDQMTLSSGAQNTQPCNQTTSSLQFTIRGGGPSVQGCINYILSAPARAGETATCDTPAKFVALSTRPDWVYDAITDTWSTTPAVTPLKSSPAYVPGTYSMAAIASDGTTMKTSASFTLTNPSSPNNCN